MSEIEDNKALYRGDVDSWSEWISLKDQGYKYILGNFTCSDNDLTSLIDGPEIVTKNYNCSENQLTNLEGAAQIVQGSFDCSENQLTTLNGAPHTVGDDFDCSVNELTSLEHIPKHIIGGFDCGYNLLTSLIGCPEIIGGSFYCEGNQLIKLEGAPSTIGYMFNCSDNQLTSLSGSPICVLNDFDCSENQLLNLEGAPDIVGGELIYDNNPLDEQHHSSGIDLLNIKLENLAHPCTEVVDASNAWAEQLNKSPSVDDRELKRQLNDLLSLYDDELNENKPLTYLSCIDFCLSNLGHFPQCPAEKKLSKVMGGYINHRTFLPPILKNRLADAIREKKFTDYFSIRITSDSLKSKEEYREAASYYKMIIHFNDDIGLWDKLADCYHQLDELTSSVDYMRQGVDSNPDKIFLKNNYGYYLYLNEEYEKACDVLQEVIESEEKAKYHNSNTYCYAAKLRINCASHLDATIKGLFSFNRYLSVPRDDSAEMFSLLKERYLDNATDLSNEVTSHE